VSVTVRDAESIDGGYVVSRPAEGDGLGTVGPVDPDMLHVSRSCAIPLSELRWRFSRSGGPGGQHANTSDTRAEVIFDVESSPSLGPRQRQRLLAKIGPEVRAVASDERSQARNRELALQRLKARIADALFIEKQRTATRPTKGSKERRLADKKRQSERKRSRRDLEE
jgi:ribosome-associated protein